MDSDHPSKFSCMTSTTNTLKIVVLTLGGRSFELSAETSWTGADMKVALKEQLQPNEWVRHLICSDSRMITDSEILQEVGLASGDALNAILVKDVNILLPDLSELAITLQEEGTVGELKKSLSVHDRVCPPVGNSGRDTKVFELVCEGRVLEDNESVLHLAGSPLTLKVVSAQYNLNNFYCASLSSKRTAAPERLNGFQEGQWPRFNNHCMECKKPLHWVHGRASGGGRECFGTFFCQSCMLMFNVQELND
eukprot:gnl/MRDRNA2_/MRDRNA2_107426_c0_seq1.p1 gnl/MRDRNA2_/MRDRNA2_107426_c0~~gnl/MRDRNA2_/MRDRNA2_107426_c0_seq1.p1  ORF type:complete len:251 (-),score=42.29 gnl/MRDRNA2_/MRDRNA2_107426_c0_seq1:434-1186(-)